VAELLVSADPYAFGERIDEVIGYRATQHPDAIAIAQGQSRLSYGDLVKQARRLAGALAASGLRRGGIVPIRIDRSPELIIALLAVLFSGGAYVLIDSSWPPERVAAVVQRTGATLAIARDGRPGQSGLAGLRIVPVTENIGDPAACPGSGDGRDAACVFFTSGSTGEPKGVVSPHRATIRALVGHPDLPLSAATVMPVASPLPWDGFSLELFAPLLHGGTAMLLPAGELLSVEVLAELIDRGVNTALLTSSLFDVLVDEAVDVVARLSLVLVGGERVSVQQTRKLLTARPNANIVNCYGPVESTIIATTHRIRPVDVGSSSTEIPVGRPVPRTGVRLLDDNHHPISRAPAAVGEIAISGDGLALGYLRDPDETARRFIDIDGERHYLSGDLGEWDAEGNLRYRGRSDAQFKWRGVRIEPGDIEANAEAHPLVTRAVVLLKLSERPGVVCAYTTNDGRPVEGPDLDKFLRTRLPAAMVPTEFHHLARLPLGPSGKIDRKRLQAQLDAAGPDVLADPVGAGSADACGQDLLSAVRIILNHPGLSHDDDLFMSGATSLDVIRIAAQTSRSGTRVTARDVYTERTVRKLMTLAKTGDPEQWPKPISRLQAGPVPLSAAQRRFWIAEQMHPGLADNMVVLAYDLSGPLDIPALRSAVDDVLEQHPVLRTCYQWTDDQPKQVLTPRADVPLEDLGQIEPAAVADNDQMITTASRATSHWWELPFDLETRPPIRVGLATATPNRHLLAIHAHHIALDGWSETVLMKDLAAAYQRHLGEGTGPRRTELTYADFAAWDNEQKGKAEAADFPYWRGQLRSAPEPFLPPPASEADESPTGIWRGLISADIVRQLTRQVGHVGAPTVAAPLAAAATAWGRMFGCSEICLGTVSPGRAVPEVEAMVGYFVNPLAIRLSLTNGSVALSDAASAVRDALAHDQIPFDELVRMLAPDRSRHPWFQAWVVIQSQPFQGAFSKGVTCTPILLTGPRTSMDVSAQLFPRDDDAWEVLFAYRRDVLDEPVAVDACQAFLNQLHGMADVPLAGQRDKPGGRS
jgi:mycobactin peptide synthetase MbtE